VKPNEIPLAMQLSSGGLTSYGYLHSSILIGSRGKYAFDVLQQIPKRAVIINHHRRHRK
jgi:hypothetical protein